VEETEGAFSVSKYSIKVAQLKINGNHKIDAIHQLVNSVCTNKTTAYECIAL